MSDAVRPCDCGLIQRLAGESASSVVYDQKMNEYNLVVDHQQWIMEYCFSCGGRLPESRRAELFTTPSATDIEALRKVMDGLKTAEQVVARLGEPDEVVERPSWLGAQPKEVVWRRQLTYTRRWSSLNLTVLELPDGRIQYLFSGKEKVPEPTPAV